MAKQMQNDNNLSLQDNTSYKQFDHMFVKVLPV